MNLHLEEITAVQSGIGNNRGNSESSPEQFDALSVLNIFFNLFSHFI